MAYFGFTNKLLKGETIQIFNYGDCKRDFTYLANRYNNDIADVLDKIYTKDLYFRD